ncbi:MAG: ribosomal RNA small subunit methyltransferase A [Acidobacteria bacterium RIFCSPLOWO2_12_FULL_67_14b]|nr:MAG: ribosomal RNA small subunit methyltransferase A [Acidobacteria bacterium RIFCSPLOWO2_12_FULL_67_14b]
MRARRRFAQHFLEPAWVTKVVAAVAATPQDAVLEIGPGRAAITRPLAEAAGRLLAIELDRDLAAELDASKPANVTVLSGDVLALDLAGTLGDWLGAPIGPGRQVRVVGNLPYNISSPILFRLLELAATTRGLSDATLMLQKEVADRLVARVGTGEYGVLTILTAVHADVKRLLSLPPGAFRPAPRVHSAVVRLQFRPPKVDIADHAAFVRMVRSMFTQRRKMLQNALRPFADGTAVSASSALAAAGIDPRRRPETLQMAELAELARAFHTPGS